MRIYQTSDYDEMSRKAADIIVAQILMKPDCVLGLATGSTPVGAYQQLSRRHAGNEVDFSQVKTVNLDEYRGILRDDINSYYYFMKNHLFNYVNIPLENTFIPDGMNPNADAECTDYEKKIAFLGGIDLQLLGLGHNGHIGFNEPDDHFPTATHCVNLTESTIEANKRFFASADNVPKQAYTMGIGTIMKAKKILLLVNGSEKAGILRKALLGPVVPQVPASILQLHSDVIVVADKDALSEIDTSDATRSYSSAS